MASQNFLTIFLIIIYLVQFSLSVTSTYNSNLNDRNNSGQALPTISTILRGHKSHLRPFFVQIYAVFDPFNHATCGGTIIRPQWVLTIAGCVCHAVIKISHIGVQIGDFTDKMKEKGIQPVIDRFCYSSYRDTHPHNDVALLKLERPIEISPDSSYFLDLCRYRAANCALTGFCGMGTVSRNYNVEPVTLRELYMEEERGGYFNRGCPEDQICAKSIVEDSNLCRGDFGGPLYMYFENSRFPMCVYGVASYTGEDPGRPYDNCTGVAHFASVPFYYRWIVTVVNMH
ncbi:chymotrypsin-2-like isoform X2 [Convolutriloba macropyga]|uniref:chymotrypsin-2-like isoform X2 n=1 Tax=Convolutriloba macropyga TaxID=536237 RepID=UPI003F526BEE